MKRSQARFVIAFADDGGSGDDGGAANVCGDTDPLCMEWDLGPDVGKPFPLPTDPMVDPNVGADGVARNPNGWLVISQTPPSIHFLWVAQDAAGTVSKVDSRTMREVARYS